MAGAFVLSGSDSPLSEGAPGPIVLVVEDEGRLVRFLRASLSAEGYRIVEATTGAQALTEAVSRQPDMILLDLGLPDMDGLDVIRRLREWSHVPIIVVSARGKEPGKVQVLDVGADDYLTKPFGIGELLARMRVAFRHAAMMTPSGESALECGDLRIDLSSRQVFRGEQEIHLTRTEYKLLATLARHPGKVLTHQQLLLEVRGPEGVEESHYLRVYMGQLRRKLEKDPARPRYIVTEVGVGYRLRTE